MSDFECSDSEEDSYLDDVFTKASEQVQRTHSSIDPSSLLELYAYYKQATVGRCNTDKPGIFNMQGRAKWSAWHDLRDMPQSEAKRLYIEKVKALDSSWSEAMQQGVKMKSVNSWVVHSIEVPPPDCQMKEEHEKNAFDYVKEGNLEGLQRVLHAKNLQQLDEHGMGLVHWAADRNHLKILNFLLDGSTGAGADVNFQDADKQTALHYAASCGHIDCVRLLLRFKAQPQIQDVDGQTCLDVAENDDIRALLNSSN